MKRRDTFSLAAAGAVALMASEAFPRWAWRRSVARGNEVYGERVDFVAQWPAPFSWQVTALDVEPGQVAGLAYHRASRYLLTDAAGLGMELLYLEYEEGNPHYFEDLFYHPPQRCMAAEGKVIDLRVRSLSVEETEIEIHCVTFRESKSQRLLHVYKAIWLHRDFPVRMGAAMHWKKIQAAMAFKPCPPARMLMAAVLGAGTEEAAWQQFHDLALTRLSSRGADRPGGAS